MELNVLPDNSRAPWYADGLKFTCTTCGNCCTGGPGFIWASDEEIGRLAEDLELSVDEVLRKYCRKVAGRVSFKEKRGPGGHDCIFLEERPVATSAKDRAASETVPLTKRICAIYSVRPLQCRTWPFWPENLASQAAWNRAGQRCPGMNQGRRHFDLQQIEALRDSEDWPDRPPTSANAP